MDEKLQGILYIIGAILLAATISTAGTLMFIDKFSEKQVRFIGSQQQLQTTNYEEKGQIIQNNTLIKQPIINNYPLPENVRNCIKVEGEKSYTLHCEVK